MTNAQIALSILNSALQVAQRIQDMLAKAQAENRDIDDHELMILKAGNDALEREILDS